MLLFLSFGTRHNSTEVSIFSEPYTLQSAEIVEALPWVVTRRHEAPAWGWILSRRVEYGVACESCISLNLDFSLLGFLLHKAFGFSTCQSCTEHWLRGRTLSPWQSGPGTAFPISPIAPSASATQPLRTPNASCVHRGQCLYGKRWEQWHSHYLVFDKNVLNSFYFLYYSTLEEKRLVKSQKT